MFDDVTQDPTVLARAQMAKKRTRIQIENEVKILDAALDVFSTYGFRGATVDMIAEKAGMSKPNLLYYFRRKQDIYQAVLERTLEMWLAPLVNMDANGEAIPQIIAYLRAKLELSRTHQQESRLFAMEVLQGAPILDEVLRNDLKAVVEAKVTTLKSWMAAGKIATIDPYHLIFIFWATTQHYADFDTQVRAVIGAGLEDEHVRVTAEETLLKLIVDGLTVR